MTMSGQRGGRTVPRLRSRSPSAEGANGKPARVQWRFAGARET